MPPKKLRKRSPHTSPSKRKLDRKEKIKITTYNEQSVRHIILEAYITDQIGDVYLYATLQGAKWVCAAVRDGEEHFTTITCHTYDAYTKSGVEAIESFANGVRKVIRGD